MKLFKFDSLGMVEFKLQHIKFQSSSMRAEKFINQTKYIETIEKERLLRIISKNTNDKIIAI